MLILIHPKCSLLQTYIHTHTVLLIEFLTGEIGLDSYNVSFNLVFSLEYFTLVLSRGHGQSEIYSFFSAFYIQFAKVYYYLCHAVF